MKAQAYKNGSASLERLFPSGFYLVRVYKGTELHDSIRCDTYRTALDYYRAFCRIAKNA